MPKVLATEIRVDNLLEWDKDLWKVLKCYHVHVGGRGGAYMQVEMKDIERGIKTNYRFDTDEKIDKAQVEAREMEYLLYHDGESFIFMDSESFEQLSNILVPPFVKKGEKIKVNTDSGEYMERA